MTELLSEVLANMEDGVYNFCKDGKCIGCGACCSDLLPLSANEIKNIKRYVKKKGIKPSRRFAPSVMNIDLTCPFFDDDKECDKCKIYPVRPDICRLFKCDTPPSQIKKNKNLFWKTRKGCSMREVIFGKD